MTTSLPISLAELLDNLRQQNRIYLNETDSTITLSRANTSNTKSVLDICNKLGWTFSIHDDSENEWNLDQISDGLEPFRVVISKPTIEGTVGFLTDHGFRNWLKAGELTSVCRVGRLNNSFSTQGTYFLNWDGDPPVFEPQAELKNPREILRVFADKIDVPTDLRRWLISDGEKPDFSNSSVLVWADLSIRNLSISLVDEVRGNDSSLILYGPPKTRYSDAFKDINCAFSVIGEKTFMNLQASAKWVFELPRETEMRHHLFTVEFSRTSNIASGYLADLKKSVEHALDSARIAYQLNLSEVSQDTLKTLSDLRKSVLDETHKLTEIIRSLATTTLGAVAIGVALIALRQASLADDALIKTLAIAVTIHVAITVFSGTRFIHLQRQLHASWQPHLYSFLPIKDFENLVVKPYKKMQRTYISVVLGSTVVMLGLNFAIFDAVYAGKAVASVLDFLVSCVRMAISLIF